MPGIYYCVLFFLLVYLQQTHSQEWYISNLNDKCLKCLCFAATDCQIERRCTEEAGYCGPYKIAQIFWIEAGNVTLPSDNPIRAGAYEDCSNDYWCAQKIISAYLRKFGQDCNDDGVTDCFDYMMLNFNGGYGCTAPLERNEFGQLWLSRYAACMAQAD